MQIPQKKSEKVLTVIKKTKVKVVHMNTHDTATSKKAAKKHPLMPPLTDFNTRYLKGRDNDPL